jgi:hypothetical protein
MIRRAAGVGYFLLVSAGATLAAAAVISAHAGGKLEKESAGEARQDGGVPNDYRLNLLIRTTLVALQQANVTGNYSVLRDLGAPDFQKVNSATKLAEAFAALRNRNLDISPILFFEPKLVRPPLIQPNGHLRLSGYFETAPEQVKFDLAYERGDKGWLLFGIAVEVSPPATVTSAPPAPKDDQKGSAVIPIPSKNAAPAPNEQRTTTPRELKNSKK